MCIVIDLTPINETVQIRGQCLCIKTGHEGKQIESMGADIANCASARSFRVCALIGLFVLGVLGYPVLCIFSLNYAKPAQISARNHLARLPY